jgi:hypothetical protein
MISIGLLVAAAVDGSIGGVKIVEIMPPVSSEDTSISGEDAIQIKEASTSVTQIITSPTKYFMAQWIVGWLGVFAADQLVVKPIVKPNFDKVKSASRYIYKTFIQSFLRR